MEDGIAVLHKQAWGRKDSLLIIRATWDTAQRKVKFDPASHLDAEKSTPSCNQFV